MKKNSLSLFSLVFLTGAILFSCSGKSKDGKGELTYDGKKLNADSIVVTETSHLFNDTTKPCCKLSIRFSYIQSATDKVVQDSINNALIATCLGNDYVGKAPQVAVTDYKNAYVKGYKNDVEQFYLEDQKKKQENEFTYAWCNYTKNIHSDVMFCDEGVLVYQINTNEYTGGAHGYKATLFLNFNMATGKRIHLKELFDEENKSALTRLLLAQLEKDNKVSSEAELEEIGYFITEPLYPTENFYFTEEGINFFYNVYEIAPYAMGTTTIKLPYSAVKSLMKEENPASELY